MNVMRLRFIGIVWVGQFFLLSSMIHATVGTVTVGESLWCIEKRIAQTADIIESKVNQLEVDFSILSEPLLSKITLFSSIIDSLNIPLLNIFSVLEFMNIKLDIDISLLDKVETQLPAISSKLADLFHCQSTAITSPTTILVSGSYCLSHDVIGTLLINASDVALDLNGHRMTGTVSVGAVDRVTIYNGSINASSALYGVQIQTGASNVTIDHVLVSNAITGISCTGLSTGVIRYCEMASNITGLELVNSVNVDIHDSIARFNSKSGFSLVTSSTNTIHDCQSLGSGFNNTTKISNNIYGFVAQNSFGNVFENCIANAAQALSTTDYNSIVAGFALVGTSNCNKIIGCEAANAITDASGVTVPYGIYLQDTLGQSITLTAVPPIPVPDASNINAVQWRPDRTYLAIGAGSADSYKIRIYSFNGAAHILSQISTATSSQIPGDTVNTIDWSPDGKYLAAGMNSSDTPRIRVYAFDATNNTLNQVATPSPALPAAVNVNVLSVRWSPNGQYLAVGMRNASTSDRVLVYAFDRVNNTLILVSIAQPGDTVNSIDWSKDGRYIAAGLNSTSTPLHVYSFVPSSSSLALVTSIAAPSSATRILSVRWSPDCSYIAAGAALVGEAADGYVGIYSFNNTNLSIQLNQFAELISSPVNSVDWSGNGRYIAAGFTGSPFLSVYGYDRGTNQLNLQATPNIAPSASGGSPKVTSVDWSPDGQYIAAVTSATSDPNKIYLYQALEFPSENVIKDNTVYCNSGASCPNGVGICGSSICNYIVGNTSYSNPINPSIVSSNYQFVCNVFNQLFNDAPSLMQNIALGSCEPIIEPDNLALILKQTIAQENLVSSYVDIVVSKLQVLQSTLDSQVTCSVIPISNATTITVSGVYCLMQDIVSPLVIQADRVALDLSNRTVTGTITVAGTSNISILNGIVDAAGNNSGIDVQSGSSDISVSYVSIKNAVRGIALDAVRQGTISHCEMIQNTTGLYANQSTDIFVEKTIARSNLLAGFSFVATSTSTLSNCTAISTGEGNANVLNNNVYGFIAHNSFSNMFENCIANATQALSTTDYNSIVAGFALTGTSNCNKIIGCEAANAITKATGVTVPYGIYLQPQFDGFITMTTVNIGGGTNNDAVFALSWSPDRKYLAVGGGYNGTILDIVAVYTYDTINNELVLLDSVQYNSSGGGLYDTTRAAVWSPDGQYIAVGGDIMLGDSISHLFIYSFDRTNEKLNLVYTARPAGERVMSISWSPDEQYLVTTALQTAVDQSYVEIYRFDRVSQTLSRVFTVNPGGTGTVDTMRTAEWSPNGDYIAVAGLISGSSSTDDLILYRFNRDTETLTQVYSTSPLAATDNIMSIDWSFDGQYLAVGGALGANPGNDLFIYKFNQTAETLSVVTSQAVRPVGFNTVRALTWSPDGKYLAVGGGSVTNVNVFFFNMYAFDRGASDLDLAATVTLSSPGPAYPVVHALSWSPDGQYLAAGGPIVDVNNGDDVIIYRVLSFPDNNVIKDNTVYCNSGAQYPSGVGICGSSICNYIVGNTAYSNPVNPPIVSSNYQFVCNVFNQLFQTAPTALQNIALGSCEPIASQEQLSLLIKQAMYQESAVASLADIVLSEADQLVSRIETLTSGCNQQPITTSTTISSAGSYCLAPNVTGSIVVSADNVLIDLGGNQLTGSILITGQNTVTIRNGAINASGAAYGMYAQAGSRTITFDQVLVRNAIRGAVCDHIDGATIKACEFSSNTTGIEFNSASNIIVRDTIARSNQKSGFSLVSSYTNMFRDCKALSTGEGNANELSNNVYGFVAQNSFGNVFENCIANATQALSTTDYNSIVAGFALAGISNCNKIIGCEAANAITNAAGVTVPYGIYLQPQFDALISVTAENTGNPATDEVRQAVWSPDGIYLAVGGYMNGDSLRVYAFDRNNQLLTLLDSVSTGTSYGISWSPDGQYVVAGVVEGERGVYLYNFDRNNEQLQLLQSTAGGTLATGISWSPDGQYLVIGVYAFGMQLYRFNPVLQQLTLLQVYALSGVEPYLSWSPDGQYVSVAYNGGLFLYRFDRSSESLIQIQSVLVGLDIRDSSWSPDGEYLAVAGYSGNGLYIYQFDLASQSLINGQNYLLGTWLNSVSWSSDGRYLAVAGVIFDLNVYLFDRGSQSLIGLQSPLELFLAYTTSWSPDGRYLAVGGYVTNEDLIIYTGLNFPSDNVIKDNTVYCNSGAQYPSGVGICGSSICNYIIGNTAYSNPINPSIVSSNYQFVCNVFNQLFQDTPSMLQNLALGSCEPISTPLGDLFFIEQALYQQSIINANLISLVDKFACASTPITTATTISTSGSYCLNNAITGSIVISASSVVLDLNNYAVSGSISITGVDDVTVQNGSVAATSSTNAIDVQAGSSNVAIRGVLVTNARRGISLQMVNGGFIERCEMVGNVTGIELDTSNNICIEKSIARNNQRSGFSLVSSYTNILSECQSLATGKNNTNDATNNVYGFVAQNSFGNVFENCIANATQALSTTDYNSIVAGFALTGTSNCNKIIGCEAANAITKASGVTVPYGIYLQPQFDGLLSVTTENTGSLSDIIYATAWSSDGVYLAVGGDLSSNALRIYIFDRGIQSLTQVDAVNTGGGGSDTVYTVVWSPDGKYLAVGGILTGNDLRVYSFDRVTQSLTQVEAVNAGGTVAKVAWSPDGIYLAVGMILTGNDLRVYSFDRVKQSLTQVDTVSPGGGADSVNTVAWSSDGVYLAVGGDLSSNALRIYIFDRGAQSLTQVDAVNTGGGGSDTVNTVAWSPDGIYLAVGGNLTGNDLRIYNFDRGAQSLTQVNAVNAGATVITVAWSPDGRYLAAGGDLTGDDLRIYSFDRGTQNLTQVDAVNPGGGGSDTVITVAWSPDGRYLAAGGDLTNQDLIVYSAFAFPSDNMIKDNTVYCNSGAQYPSGVGICGSSICNYIVGNTAYSNPINPPIVSSNYQFVCNVFDQLFGDAPTELQNIALGSCEPIAIPGNLTLILNQVLAALQGLGNCAPTALTSSTPPATTLTASGGYCLAADITSDITITGTCIVLDLNDHCLTGIITVQNSDDVLIQRGSITPSAPTSAPAAAITVSSTVNRAMIKNAVIACTNTSTAGIAGRAGISIAANNTQVYGCTITSGAGANGTAGGTGGDGIILASDATQTMIQACTITTGTGGNSSAGAGARGGHGIAVQNGASDAEITECLIARTGGGGSGTATGGDGGDGVNITSGASRIAVQKCVIRNTGSGGSGSPAGRGGQAVHDAVVSSATESLIFKNFAFAIADATKFDIQALGETGILTPNPPTGTIINPFANVFAS